jgi:hypothetical protein
MTVTFSSRKIYEADQARTDVNQNLRSALDLIGMDLRQPGERLPDDFPVLAVVDGAGGLPDVLVIRRNLLEAVLPLCQQVNAGSSTDDVRVVDLGPSPPQGCDPVPDDDGNGWPDNIDEWREFRTVHGGAVSGYLYDPIDHLGEFFVYDDESTTHEYLDRGGSGGWQNTYLVNQMCRVYMIEERAYRLDQDVLGYVVNGDVDNPVNLVARVTDFQLRAIFADGTETTTLGPADAWDELRAIEVVISGESEVRGRTMRRTLSARFFPRNILSL